MLVFPLHILANPLVLPLAVVDAYILTAALYLIVNRLARGSSVGWHPGLSRLIAGPAQAVERWLVRWRGRAIPRWQSWAVVFGAALVVREVLAAVVMATL
jgi:hypothetical protein